MDDKRRRPSLFLSIQGVVAAASRRNANRAEDTRKDWLRQSSFQGDGRMTGGLTTLGILGAIVVALVCGLFLGMLLFQPTVVIAGYDPTSSSKLSFYETRDLAGVKVDVDVVMVIENTSRVPGQLKFSGSLADTTGIQLVALGNGTLSVVIMTGYVKGLSSSGGVNRSVVPLKARQALVVDFAFHGATSGFGLATFDDYALRLAA